MKILFTSMFLFAAGAEEGSGGTTPEMIKSASASKPVTIDLTQRVKVYSNEQDPHHATGEEMNIAPALAQHLLDNGMVSKTKEAALKTVKAK